MTAPTFSLEKQAYDICHEFYTTCNKIETERKDQFDQQKTIKKIAYYAVTAFAWIALIATPSCLALAAINFSLGWLAVAAISAAAVYGLGILRGKFNTITADEEPCLKQFQNPLGVVKNQESIPEATALHNKTLYFENLVVPPDAESAKAKKERETKLAVAKKMFEGKITEEELKKRIHSVAFTGLMLEAIQNAYDKAPKDVQEIKDFDKRAELLLKESTFSQKIGNETDAVTTLRVANLKKLITELKKPNQAFITQLTAKVSSKDSKPVYKMHDLETAFKIVNP